MSLKVAILVDGSFFLKRYNSIITKGKEHSPETVASKLYTFCMKHVESQEYLYRILYYDCKPLEKKVHNPISGRAIDFKKSEMAIFRNNFYAELKKKRKVALRLGYIQSNNHWVLKPDKTKALLKREISIDDLRDDDVVYQMQQKSVDMKIGLDISSMALKKSVQKIVLISGDGDFVPAAKMARREGIDFVLDPMWNHIDDSLFEHIDGLRSTIPKPNYLKKKTKSEKKISTKAMKKEKG